AMAPVPAMAKATAVVATVAVTSARGRVRAATRASGIGARSPAACASGMTEAMTTAATVRPPKIATDANSIGLSGGEFFTIQVCLVCAGAPGVAVDDRHRPCPKRSLFKNRHKCAVRVVGFATWADSCPHGLMTPLSVYEMTGLSPELEEEA